MKNVHIFDIDYDITDDDIPDGMTEDELRFCRTLNIPLWLLFHRI